MARKKSVRSFGVYLTKPSCIANYFNDYFMNEVSRIRDEMASTGVSVSEELLMINICRSSMYDER